MDMARHNPVHTLSVLRLTRGAGLNPIRASANGEVHGHRQSKVSLR